MSIGFFFFGGVEVGVPVGVEDREGQVTGGMGEERVLVINIWEEEFFRRRIGEE